MQARAAPTSRASLVLTANQDLLDRDAVGARWGRGATISVVAYNKDQWTASFEGQLSILRPHLSERVLSTMSLSAWQQYGRKDRDPIEAARDWSKGLDAQKSPEAKR